MFLVNVFTEGKKVVGKAFLSKKRFLVNFRGLLIAIYYWNDYIIKPTITIKI